MLRRLSPALISASFPRLGDIAVVVCVTQSIDVVVCVTEICVTRPPLLLECVAS